MIKLWVKVKANIITLVIDFIIKDLPSVLIFVIADPYLDHSLCCSYKYN